MSSQSKASTAQQRASQGRRGFGWTRSVGGLFVAVAIAVGALAAPSIASAHPNHHYRHDHRHGDYRRHDRPRYERRAWRKDWRDYRRDRRLERRFDRLDRFERRLDRRERRLDRRDRRYERRWRLGHRLPHHVRYKEIRDYRRYRLGPPPRGHFYAHVDRDVVLVARATLGVVTFLGAIDALSRRY